MKDPEIEAMSTCTKVLEELDNESKKRVIDYVISRFNLSEKVKNTSVEMEGVPHFQENKNDKKNKRKKRSNRSTVKSSKSLQSYNLLNDLNLYPTEKESLKDFFEKYTSKSFFDKNLIYVYYMERVAGIQGISVDHVYTCFKKTSQKVPKSKQ